MISQFNSRVDHSDTDTTSSFTSSSSRKQQSAAGSSGYSFTHEGVSERGFNDINPL